MYAYSDSGWAGWACERLLGAFGHAVLASLDGAFLGSYVPLPAGRQISGSKILQNLKLVVLKY
jgi:hypothetical protein